MQRLAKLRFVWLSGVLFLALAAGVAHGAKNLVFVTAHGAKGSAGENPARRLAERLLSAEIGKRIISPEPTPLEDIKAPSGPVRDQIRVMRDAVLSTSPSSEEVAYVGFSMGAKIAGEVTRDLEDRVKYVIALAPPINMIPGYIRSLIGLGHSGLDPKMSKWRLIEAFKKVQQRLAEQEQTLSNVYRYESLKEQIDQHRFMQDVVEIGERKLDRRPTVPTFVGVGANDQVVWMPKLKHFIELYDLPSFEAPRLGHDFRAMIEGYPGFESYPDATATEAGWAGLVNAASAFLRRSVF